MIAGIFVSRNNDTNWLFYSVKYLHDLFCKNDINQLLL